MTAIIVYPSALEYWLEARGIPYSHFIDIKHYRTDPSNLFLQSFSRTDLQETLDTLSFTAPVHVAVPHGKNRNGTDNYIYHSFSEHTPPNSFVPMPDNIFLSSPEMCFLQAAQYLNIPELVVLSNELCATYYEDSYSAYGQAKRAPITTVASIRQFLEKAGSYRGVHKALQAIQYTSDNSHSPMESLIAALAALPLHRGGYALSKFTLNDGINLSKEGRKLLGSDRIRGDIVWPEQKVIAEYDSKLAHFNTEKFYNDKNRVAALSALGYSVFQITSNNVASFSAIEDLFLMIRDALGMKPRPSRFDKYFEKRYDVVKNLRFGQRDIYRRRRLYYPGS